MRATFMAVLVAAMSVAGCADDRQEPSRTSAERGQERDPASSGPTDALPPVVELSKLPDFGGGEVPREVVAAAQEFGAGHADHFAGLLVAQGQVWLGFTSDAEGHLAELLARAGEDVPARAFRARHTEAELRALQGTVTSDMAALRDRGVHVSKVGVSVQRNRVEIGIEDDDPRAIRLLLDRYSQEMVYVSTGVVIRPVGS